MSKVKEYYLEEEYNPIEAIDKLQQENTKLRIQISAREEEYIKLQEENTKLKELCDKYEEEHNTEFKIWKDERYQLLDYKSINGKIINKISLYRMDDITMETNRILDDLLNTARGVDKE